jgi:hypothetical protein
MFHDLQDVSGLSSYLLGGSAVSDLIYVSYLAFMWGAVGLSRYLDTRRPLRKQNVRMYSGCQ